MFASNSCMWSFCDWIFALSSKFSFTCDWTSADTTSVFASSSFRCFFCDWTSAVSAESCLLCVLLHILSSPISLSFSANLFWKCETTIPRWDDTFSLRCRAICIWGQHTWQPTHSNSQPTSRRVHSSLTCLSSSWRWTVPTSQLFGQSTG